mmetsp:Transcript_8451/g.33397  ORF Transcript_8451/g.33397 Transcript_8451/m.33397 type:complete len:217 (+) Transcript_8451:1762-2412(+)
MRITSSLDGPEAAAQCQPPSKPRPSSSTEWAPPVEATLHAPAPATAPEPAAAAATPPALAPDGARERAAVPWSSGVCFTACTCPRAPPAYRKWGASRNWTRTSALRSFRPLPHLRMKGTPFQRWFWMNTTVVAKVGVVEPSGTPSSSRYALWSESPRYCPVTVSSSRTGTTERSTLTFSSRTSSADRLTGGSIATMDMTWVRWFCMMSRMIPYWSK